MLCALHQIKKNFGKLATKFKSWIFENSSDCISIFKGFKLNWTAVEVEPDCDCNDIGTESKDCKKETEQCSCKSGYMGAECDQCTEEYWNSSGGEFQSTIHLLLFVCSMVMGHGASLSSLWLMIVTVYEEFP